VVRNGGVRGIVISLAGAGFSGIQAEGCRLHCGAGALLKLIASRARDLSLSGFEFLEGIPGSLGGALRMNAGAMGAAVFDRVESVRVMDYSGRVSECAAAQMNAQYRGCPALKNAIALSAVLTGEPGASRAEISDTMKTLGRKRWQSQPKEPSAGCSFKNPKAMTAGKLIDLLGLKGLRVGGAVVSTVHGNFIVNDGTASAADVLELMRQVRERVKAAEGIDLDPEVEVIGEDPLPARGTASNR
jgi:UDP-N-acetylenolpyruvoylglucosamine reductase